MEEYEYRWLQRKLFEITGINFEHYRQQQMRRLLDKALERSGVRSYVALVKLLEKHPEQVQDFKNSLTINVSSLFRDFERWRSLEEMLPGVIVQKAGSSLKAGEVTRLHVWSAGCATGAEPCTITIILEELRASGRCPPFSYSVTCTDIDSAILRQAREALFSKRCVSEVPPALLEKYFDKIEPEKGGGPASDVAPTFAFMPDYKKNMRFRLHNILDDYWDSGFDLIVCRNVLIYFKNEVKETLLRKFCKSLNSKGILFIGSTEVVFKPENFGLKPVASGIYRKDLTGGESPK